MKILFVNPFGIGDLLFTTPLARALKKRGHTVYYWCNKRTQGIIRHNDAVSGFFALSRGDLKKEFRSSPLGAAGKFLSLARSLKKERFDTALDFSLDSRYSLLLRLLGVRKLAGFDYKGRGRFLTHPVKMNGFHSRHMIDYYGMLLKYADEGALSSGETELFTGDEEMSWADGFLKEQGVGYKETVIGIAPGGGGSWGTDAYRKQWPKEKFAAVAGSLVVKYGLKIILFGSEEDEVICSFIGSRVKKNIINTCGVLNIERFAELLKRCLVLITNDGGPLHMACALGVKTISIFGPVSELVYGPSGRSGEDIVVTGDADCRPCYRHFRYPVCEDRICLKNIEPSRVLEAASGFLNKASSD